MKVYFINQLLLLIIYIKYIMKGNLSNHQKSNFLRYFKICEENLYVNASITIK